MKNSRSVFSYSPPRPAGRKDNGSVLFMVLALVAALTFVGATLFSVTSIGMRISGNYKQSVEAFHNADAGMKYVEARLLANIASGTLRLRGEVVPVNITAPAGFNFDPVPQLKRMGDKKSYLYRVTGRSGNARCTVEAVVQKDGGYGWGLFGGDHVNINRGAYSRGGNVGSNGYIEVDARGGAGIDGDATPGPGEAVTGNPAAVTGSTAPAAELVVLDPIDPHDLAYAKTHNNNAAIPAGFLAGDDFALGSRQTVTFPAGTYYFTHFEVGNEAALNTVGEVIIYCDGGVDIKNGSTSDNTDADLLRIYTTSDGSVNIRHGSEFHGHLYAPYAKTVEVKADGGFYGSVVCGGIVEAKTDGQFFLEGNSDIGTDWMVTAWKLIRY